MQEDQAGGSDRGTRDKCGRVSAYSFSSTVLNPINTNFSDFRHPGNVSFSKLNSVINIKRKKKKRAFAKI